MNSSELIANALSAYDWALSEIEKGKAIASLDEAKRSYAEVDMVAFKMAAAHQSANVTVNEMVAAGHAAALLKRIGAGKGDPSTGKDGAAR